MQSSNAQATKLAVPVSSGVAADTLPPRKRARTDDDMFPESKSNIVETTTTGAPVTCIPEFDATKSVSLGERCFTDLYAKGRSSHVKIVLAGAGGTIPPFSCQVDKYNKRDFIFNMDKPQHLEQAEELRAALIRTVQQNPSKFFPEGCDPGELELSGVGQEREVGGRSIRQVRCKISKKTQFWDGGNNVSVPVENVSKFDWQTVTFLVKGIWIDGAGKAGCTIEAGNVVLCPKTSGSNPTGVVVPVSSEGTFSSVRFRLAKNDDSMKKMVHVEHSGGGSLVLSFDRGGTFPPFALDYSKMGPGEEVENRSPKLNFRVEDDAEISSIRQLEAGFGNAIVENARDWVMGWTPEVLEVVTKSKITKWMKPCRSGNGFFFSAKIGDVRTVVCETTEGESVALEDIPGMRFSKVDVTILSVFSNHTQIGCVKRVSRIVVFPF